MSSTTQQQLQQALQQLNPVQLQITDDSHLHAGHAGNTGGGHFTVFIVSEAFNGLSPLKRHRLVYEAAAELLPSTIHALSIQAKTPAELN
ncbi:BolA family protein [Methylophaga pinxianii]|uniref:BolA family protein n=1 Tax=Methylophaga pinxianii TaxID=2881052 RepID=UPI001CF48936|nr:BolA family protein [Methylophaga pinxianii]MCB2427750.1 BolA family transcriptional regulator [Methylophaga pinxianii]UPH45643.1 BolA family transcriptional regulator [Methylophaga pinxianii]